MCATLPTTRRQSILMWTTTSKLRLFSWSSPLDVPSAYFRAVNEKDRKVPSGRTMWPDPVAEATTVFEAAGACATAVATGSVTTATSTTATRMITSLALTESHQGSPVQVRLGPT